MYSIETFYDHFVVCRDGEILYHVDNKKQAQDDIREMEQNIDLEKDIIFNHNSKNYTVYHLHDDNSLLDSCTSYKQYIDRAVELGQKSIFFTNHGNIHNWIEKKMYCDEMGIKTNLSVECYLTEHLEPKIRDNYHTVLISKNEQGKAELLRLLFNATDDEHKYYKPRISFDEFLNISDNIIKISACLASPLNRIRDISRVDKLFKHYDYYEIQYHNGDQIEYNQYLYKMSKKYGKPLIVGTDTHSLDKYKAECRVILQRGKDAEFGKGDTDSSNEEEYDLTYKSYNELIEVFTQQNSLPMDIVLEAIDNTNIMADSVDPFELDTSIKYPILYGDKDEEILWQTLRDKYKYKLDNGIITKDQRYIDDIKEEMRVFKKVDMVGFMLFMSELMTFCREQGIYTSPCRGSVGGSMVAYISDITDVNPIIWNTVFSRFCNEDRKEIGDIDIDVYEDQRSIVFDYIINRFGREKTAFVLSVGTMVDKGAIDCIGKALRITWARKNSNGDKTECNKLEKGFDNPWNLSKIKEIKGEYESNPDSAKEKYPELFYYFDGLMNCIVSQSRHPAGIIASPITLHDNYGMFIDDEGNYVLPINMEEVHEVGLAKYDILGLKNVGVIRKCCEYANIKPPLSHEINWEDMEVFKEVLKSPIGMFQFEGDYSYKLLCDYIKFKMSEGIKPTVDDFTVVNACLRPSGESYRDKLIRGEFNNNPSKIIDDLLSDTRGFLVFQEQTILFLQEICGLNGSEADNIRRAIGRKQIDRLQKAMPSILEGYCRMSDQPREIAEEEAKQFLQIIEDSSSYQFGKNHSVGYSLVGYILMWLRHYYPIEFCTAYLNCANNEQDIKDGTILANQLGIKIDKPKFGKSLSDFVSDAENNTIYKGLGSIKSIGKSVGDDLYSLKDNKYNDFFMVLKDIKDKTKLNKKSRDILIKLDYFSQFGHPHQLLSQVTIYAELSTFYNKFKTAKKPSKSLFEQLSIPLDEVATIADKESPKQFTITDNEALLKLFKKYYKQILAQVSAKYPYHPTTILDKIKYEVELLGYTDLIDESVNDNYYIVCGVETNQWGTAFSTLYQISSGYQQVYKVDKKYYQQYPFKVGDILNCFFDVKQCGHYETIEGQEKKKWVLDNEYETILKKYSIK